MQMAPGHPDRTRPQIANDRPLATRVCRLDLGTIQFRRSKGIGNPDGSLCTPTEVPVTNDTRGNRKNEKRTLQGSCGLTYVRHDGNTPRYRIRDRYHGAVLRKSGAGALGSGEEDLSISKGDKRLEFSLWREEGGLTRLGGC